MLGKAVKLLYILTSEWVLYTRGSQPPGPVLGPEKGPSGTRKVAKVVFFTQLWWMPHGTNIFYKTGCRDLGPKRLGTTALDHSVTTAGFNSGTEREPSIYMSFNDHLFGRLDSFRHFSCIIMSCFILRDVVDTFL